MNYRDNFNVCIEITAEAVGETGVGTQDQALLAVVQGEAFLALHLDDSLHNNNVHAKK